MQEPELDKLLEEAQASPGLAVQTSNARRLMIMLRNRIGQVRKIHPAAYAGLSIIASKSPLEFYIVNRAFGPQETSDGGPEGGAT